MELVTVRTDLRGPDGIEKATVGKAIRSQAWPGIGGQEGSETSGVSPNNNPRPERPASVVVLDSARRPSPALGRSESTGAEDEIVQASRKREGP